MLCTCGMSERTLGVTCDVQASRLGGVEIPVASCYRNWDNILHAAGKNLFKSCIHFVSSTYSLLEDSYSFDVIEFHEFP